MANIEGFPYCTEWKKYRYPLTCISPDHVTEVTATGHFGTSTHKPSVWIDADYFLSETDIVYKLVFEKHGVGLGVKHSCSTIQRPRRFVDGAVGTHSLGYTTSYRWFDMGSVDNNQSLDCISSLLPYKDQFGNNRSLYPLGPGIYISLAAGPLGVPEIDDNHEYSFRVKSTALDGLPKIMDGTFTSYHHTPQDGGDTVVTEPIPFTGTQQSFVLSYNHEPTFAAKIHTAGANYGVTVWIEVSDDKVNWVTKPDELVDDYEFITGIPAQNIWGFTARYDAETASDSWHAKYMRLKFELKEESGGEAATPVIKPYQYIKTTITPT